MPTQYCLRVWCKCCNSQKSFCTEATRNISWFKNNIMEANTNKFEFILFGTNVKPVTEPISFSDITIPCASEVKLLGVTYQ